MSKRTRSIAFLGVYFALHWLRMVGRIFTGRPGLKRFRKLYDHDGVGHFTERDFQTLAGLSRCVSCSICELRLAEEGPAPNGVYRSPSLLASLLLRTPLTTAHSRQWMNALEGMPWSELRCPYGVPLEAGMELARRTLVPGPTTPAEP